MYSKNYKLFFRKKPQDFLIFQYSVSLDRGGSFQVNGNGVVDAGGDANGDPNANADLNVNVDLKLPCGLDKEDYGVSDWTKQELSASVIQCLCELKDTKIGSIGQQLYNFFIQTTSIEVSKLN